jgi:hypothetical protein
MEGGIMFGFDNDGNFGVLILALLSLLIIGGLFMIPPLIINSFNNPINHRDTNCSVIENLSESKIITRTLLMPMGKGALMPMITHHTEYHHYNVCLNGSTYDAGWY